MESLVILLVVVYSVFALSSAASAAWSSAARFGDRIAMPDAVVVVAARNEEEALPGCLAALARQRYADGHLRIVVADDGSDDGTEAVVQAFSPDIEYLRVPDGLGLRGKAAAIHAAVSEASEEIVLLTDADCRPPQDWAQNLAAQLISDGTGVVSGVTSIIGTSSPGSLPTASPASPAVSQGSGRRLTRMQALDWGLLLTVAAGLSGAGVPVSAMGNNMAFRRKAYEDVGGYPALSPSVTEDYALFRAIHRAGWRARLLLDKRLENVTLPLTSLREVFAQRKRWARGGLRSGLWVYLIYILMWCTHVAVLAGFATVPSTGLAALAVKLGADAAVLRVGTSRLGRPAYWKTFAVFEAYFFVYVIALPFSLLTSPRITWRGRQY